MRILVSTQLRPKGIPIPIWMDLFEQKQLVLRACNRGYGHFEPYNHEAVRLRKLLLGYKIASASGPSRRRMFQVHLCNLVMF